MADRRQRTGRRRGLVTAASLLLVLAAVGCDKAESVATEGIGRVTSAAAGEARDFAETASSAAKDQLASLGDRAGAYVDERLASLLAGAADGSLEAWIVGQKSSAPEVVRIAKAIGGSISSDTTVLPIYRPVADKAAVDEQIGDMPRVEVIDGVTVGFSQVRKLDPKEKVDEDAYLVLWRRDATLVGFVYQKKSRIDLETLIAETPRLMKLMRR